MQTQKVNICLVGGGRIGTIHLNDLITFTRINIVAVVEFSEKRRLEMAEQAKCNGYATFQDALDDENITIQAAIICTPTFTHTELIKLALSRGIHVFCEKPIAESTSEIDELYNLAKEKDLFLLCGFQRRFDPTFMKLKESVAKGSIGKVQVIKTTSRDHPLPSFEFLKSSGGIFHDCASHDIDIHRWVVGEDPIEVYATGYANFKEIEEMDDLDTVIIVLKFPSGTIGTIDLHRDAKYGYDQRIEVMGDKGMVQANNPHRTSFVLATDQGFLSDQIHHSFGQRYTDAYKSEMEHFLDLVNNEASEMKITHRDVRTVEIICNAALKSSKTGMPVKIEYD